MVTVVVTAFAGTITLKPLCFQGIFLFRDGSDRVSQFIHANNNPCIVFNLDTRISEIALEVEKTVITVTCGLKPLIFKGFCGDSCMRKLSQDYHYCHIYARKSAVS